MTEHPSIPPPDYDPEKLVEKTKSYTERTVDNPFDRFRNISSRERTWGVPLPNPRTGDYYIKTRWRPFIAWQYFFVCVFDFIIAPAATMYFFQNNIENYVQWSPLTLQGGGLYHIAMGTIIGVTAYGRTQEKINGIEN